MTLVDLASQPGSACCVTGGTGGPALEGAGLPALTPTLPVSSSAGELIMSLQAWPGPASQAGLICSWPDPVFHQPRTLASLVCFGTSPGSATLPGSTPPAVRPWEVGATAQLWAPAALAGVSWLGEASQLG